MSKDYLNPDHVPPHRRKDHSNNLLFEHVNIFLCIEERVFNSLLLVFQRIEIASIASETTACGHCHLHYYAMMMLVATTLFG